MTRSYSRETREQGGENGRVPPLAESYQGQVPQMKNDNGDYVVFVYIILSLILCFIISLFTPIGASPITMLR